MNWPTPQNVSHVRSFNGLTCYFRKYVRAYSMMIAPLTHLTKQTTPWEWTPACQKAFEDVKHALTNAPALMMPDFADPTGFELLSDASMYGIGAVLTQRGQPIAYESKKLSPAETNWTTGDQELWAVIHALKVWRCYLEGVKFLIVTDHSPLTHLKTQPSLSRRQARWSEYLSRFDFDWIYRPGRDNVADPLSRHPDFSAAILAVLGTRVSSRIAERRRNATAQQALPNGKRKHVTFADPAVSHRYSPPPEHAPAAHAPAHRSVPQDDMVSQMHAGYRSDPWFRDAKNTSSLTYRDGLWWTEDAVVVPNLPAVRKGILHELHDAPYSGHVGVTKTLHAVRRAFWWPNMRHEVTAYVNACSSCQRNKMSGLLPGGKLQPLPIPSQPWQSVSMDFITQLPRSIHGNDAVFVVVDRLTKMVHIIPTKTTVTSEGTAQLFLDNVWKHHGVPQDIVSDRGSVFVGKFFTELLRLIGTRHNRSTAFHPQSDGQTERMNRVLEDMLRHYVAGRHGDWEQYLSTAEFAINNAFQESIGTTPFRLNSGRDPRTPVSIDGQPSLVPSAAAFADRMSTGLSDAKKCMQSAQQRQKLYADRKRRDVSFAVGDSVLLSTRNITMRMTGDRSSTPKLFPKFIGPFPIVKRVGPVAYKLTLPESMRIHNVFHVSLLKPYRTDGYVQPPEPLVLNDEATFLLERILDHKTIKVGRRTDREYLVKWQSHGSDHNSWVPETTLAASDGPALHAYWEYVGLEPPPRTFPESSP